jgi:hypothetical protein
MGWFTSSNGDGRNNGSDSKAAEKFRREAKDDRDYERGLRGKGRIVRDGTSAKIRDKLDRTRVTVEPGDYDDANAKNRKRINDYRNPNRVDITQGHLDED